MFSHWLACPHPRPTCVNRPLTNRTYFANTAFIPATVSCSIAWPLHRATSTWNIMHTHGRRLHTCNVHTFSRLTLWWRGQERVDLVPIPIISLSALNIILVDINTCSVKMRMHMLCTENFLFNLSRSHIMQLWMSSKFKGEKNKEIKNNNEEEV